MTEQLRNIRQRDLECRPTPRSRNVRELVRHILEVTIMMIGELTRPGAPCPRLLARYARPAYRARTRIQLLLVLRSQVRHAERLVRFDGERGTKFTRSAWHRTRATGANSHSTRDCSGGNRL